jgi:hypothetical protein
MRKLYLIQSNEGKYKIGISKNPSKRIEQLQTGSPDVLKLIHTYESPNAFKIETALHNKYQYLREHGEWFDMSISEEVDFLKNCKKIDESIKTLRKMGNEFI